MTADAAWLRFAADGSAGTAVGHTASWDAASWYVLAPGPSAGLHPALAALLHRHGAERPDLDVVYGDAAVQEAPGQPPRRVDRPEFDATRLIAQDYVGLPLALRGQALAALGGLDAAAGSAAGYDLLLRAAAVGLGVGRIDEVLGIVTRGAVQATDQDRMAARRRVLAHSHPDCDVVPGRLPGTAELRRRFSALPPVTVVILPGREPGPPGVPSDLLQSLGRTDWPGDRLHLLVENGLATDSAVRLPFAVRRLPGAPSTSLAARVNALWRHSDTDQVVLLDPAALATGPGWLRALMTFAVQDGVGGVGARLLDPDGSIRAAEGLASLVDPAAADAQGPEVQHERSIVTGQGFATRVSVLEQANGLDERLGAAAGHADLCLRLRQLGLRIINTPHAELVQRDLAPRDPPRPEQTALFLEKWQHLLAEPGRTTPPSADPEAAWWRQSPSKRPISPGLAKDGGFEAGAGADSGAEGGEDGAEDGRAGGTQSA